jgi:hypothetical protein
MYKRLYDAGQLGGMSLGSLSPRAGDRYDRIKNQKDLMPDDASKMIGDAVDADGKSVMNAQVFVLPNPPQGSVDVYLQSGQIRNELEENVVRTDASGHFFIHPEPDDVFIVACHSEGFFITTLENFKADPTVRLNRWARMHGRISREDEMKQTIHFTSYPIANVSFHLYEVGVGDDGSFDERFVPPGKLYVQRSVPAGKGMSLSFRASEWILIPGESEEVDVGAIPDDQKRQVEAEIRRNQR